MAESGRPPAFYAAGAGGWRDWWTLLHPPYTLWHLSYVAIGAGLAPKFDGGRLAATLAAFFLAVGVSAHALDEFNGRPLRTSIPRPVLLAAALASLAGAATIGVVMLARVEGSVAFAVGAVALIAIGVFLVVAYDLELFDGRFHTDAAFSAAWGSFPVLTAYYAQAERLDAVAVVAAGGAFALSWAQRSLSTPARHLRRRTREAVLLLRLEDGREEVHGTDALLDPLEGTLRALSWASVALGVAVVAARLLPS